MILTEIQHYVAEIENVYIIATITSLFETYTGERS